MIVSQILPDLKIKIFMKFGKFVSYKSTTFKNNVYQNIQFRWKTPSNPNSHFRVDECLMVSRSSPICRSVEFKPRQYDDTGCIDSDVLAKSFVDLYKVGTTGYFNLLQAVTNTFDANIKAIYYEEYLPKVLGSSFASTSIFLINKVDSCRGYDSNVDDSTVANEFTSGSYHYGHGKTQDFKQFDLNTTFPFGSFVFNGGLIVSRNKLFGSVRSFSTDINSGADLFTVFIGPVPKKTKKEEVDMFFAGYGHHHIKKKGDSFYVDFKCELDAIKAVESLNCREFNGKRVFVQLDKKIQKVKIDWNTYPMEFKHYDPFKLIEAGKFYLKQSPPDTLQFSEKYWYSASFSIKLLALEYGIELGSHKSVKDFTFFIALHPLIYNIDQGITTKILYNGYISAECLHKYCYNHLVHEDTSISKQNVEKFVNVLYDNKYRSIVKEVIANSDFSEYKEEKGISYLADENFVEENKSDRISCNDTIICKEMKPTAIDLEPILQQSRQMISK